ncbi:MAG: LamB/YcsF family protein [Sphingobacteriales bacterium]|nr:MAG: LamB/YcsF family protein [Sphingobacteriales bacterium]
MRTIDINCDMGEGFGTWTLADDAYLMDFISSANIACGFHAGDPGTMQRTSELAVSRGVAIGAHPSFPDLQGFGRRNMNMSESEIYQLVLYQLGALAAFVKAAKGALHHVKPHGALYNMAAKSSSISVAIARAIADFDDTLILYGPAGSDLLRAGQSTGLRTACEAFTERGYMSDYSLAPRSMPGAIIEDAGEMRAQLLNIVSGKPVTTLDGKQLIIQADTICLHSDNKNARTFAQEIKSALTGMNITIRTI